MSIRNIVYIAQSLDGYIADKDGGLDWLHAVPNPDNDDCGFVEFIDGIDAIVMGRTTFETVVGFDCEWPYPVPVFVLSNTLNTIPEGYADKASLVSGELKTMIKSLNEKGYKSLYIDGGKVIQSFLEQDLIDDLVVTTIPVLLGGGAPLFWNLSKQQEYTLIKSEVHLGQLVKNHYQRKR